MMLFVKKNQYFSNLPTIQYISDSGFSKMDNVVGFRVFATDYRFAAIKYI